MRISNSQRVILQYLSDRRSGTSYEEEIMAAVRKSRPRCRQSLKALESKALVYRENWHMWRITKKGRSALLTKNERIVQELTEAQKRVLCGLSSVYTRRLPTSTAKRLDELGLVEVHTTAKLTGTGQSVVVHLWKKGRKKKK